jgi:Zn-dependent protease with chaperone function
MSNRASQPIEVAPHPAEMPLRILLMLIAIGLWILFVVSVLGLIYGIFIGLFFFFAQLSLIAHLRGSSVKLGPDQLPGLYSRVVHIARRIGMDPIPDVYLRQSGGVLNAFATRFGQRRFVVLFSDLIRSCGNNLDALDFIIAHELGHIHRGHLNWRWLMAPGLLIPFLGTAYSRVCEYTCDRYGFLAASDPNRGLDGLCVLAAGSQFVSYVNKEAFVAQRDDLNTAFMTLGQWFATHPPLARRVAALAPSLNQSGGNGFSATAGALLILVVLFAGPVVGGIWFVQAAIESAKNSLTTNLGGNTGYFKP